MSASSVQESSALKCHTRTTLLHLLKIQDDDKYGIEASLSERGGVLEVVLDSTTCSSTMTSDSQLL